MTYITGHDRSQLLLLPEVGGPGGRCDASRRTAAVIPAAPQSRGKFFFQQVLNKAPDVLADPSLQRIKPIRTSNGTSSAIAISFVMA